MYKAFPSPSDSNRAVLAQQSALGGWMLITDYPTLALAEKEASRLERNHQVAEAVRQTFSSENGNHRFFDGDQALLFEAD